jgi:hypothetical protein
MNLYVTWNSKYIDTGIADIKDKNIGLTDNNFIFFLIPIPTLFGLIN